MTDTIDLTDLRVKVALPSGRSAPTLTDYLANNAVANVRDFGAVGDGKSDDTRAFRAALAAIPHGGRLLIPSGWYKVTDEIRLHAGVLVEGEGSPDFAFGAPPATDAVPSLVWQASPGKAVFAIGGTMHNVRMQDLSLAPTLTPTSTPIGDDRLGVRIEGSYPAFVWNLSFERCTFYNFRTAISCIDPFAGQPSAPHLYDWSVAPVSIVDCRFYYPQTGVYIDTGNADDWVIDRCAFFVAVRGEGVYLWRFGFMHLVNSFGAGETAVGNRFIRIRGNGSFSVDNVLIENCQGETLTEFLRLERDGTYGKLPLNITVKASIAEMGSSVYLGNQCRFFSENNRWSANLHVDSTEVRIASVLDRFEQGFSFVFDRGSASECFQYLLPGPDTAPAYAQETYVNGRLRRHARSAPTSGTYKTGDLVHNAAPVAGAPIGWVCTADGTPGHWEPYGIVGARPAAPVPDVETASATDLRSAITLVNALKASHNALLASRRAAHEQG